MDENFTGEEDKHNFDRMKDEDDDDFEPLKINPQSDPRIQAQQSDFNMRSLSTRMIASSLIPKVSVLKKALKSADIYIKFERILEEFNSLMFYNSIIELLTFFVGFVCFCSYPSQMGFIWMHLLHIPRGAFGIFLVLKKTPKTYDLIESISDFNDDQLEEHWGFEKMAQHIRENFKKHLVNVLSANRKFFVVYVIISWLSVSLDIIDMLIQLIRFGSKGHEYSDLFMLAVVIIFLYTQFNYFCWVMTFTFRIEPKYRRDAIRAGFGFANGLQSRVRHSFQEYKNKMFSKNEPPRNPNGLGGNRGDLGQNAAARTSL